MLIDISKCQHFAKPLLGCSGESAPLGELRGFPDCKVCEVVAMKFKLMVYGMVLWPLYEPTKPPGSTDVRVGCDLDGVLVEGREDFDSRTFVSSLPGRTRSAKKSTIVTAQIKTTGSACSRS